MTGAKIRVCVSDGSYERFFTWYDNDTVITWRRDMDIYQTTHDIRTLAEFNWWLTAINILPVGSGRGKKEPEPVPMQYDSVPF